ncbi:aKG-HExxH-type peptide beta-hydroxylase [Cupriavidus sp. IDO]|uniref:aKG-HExxH-type peptide beta-hydroxylase n=1 Tax=Cupriavidus sp. IDO TaxID=1539142 RepID=UPI0007C831FB|nr:HEXXH motif-containing putative peptide modification protein [Cupriavidus sp. IDO]
MILQFGVHAQIDNLVTLIGSRNLAEARSLATISQVQSEYRAFIEHLQRRVPSGKPGVVGFVTDFETAKRLRSLFVNDSLIDDKAQAEVIAEGREPDIAVKQQLITRALAELSLYSRDHRVLFDTVITDILILPSKVARAGSTSQAIGVIWANPRIDYTLHDVIELLVHELTHHAMFIDEIRYSHYDYGSIVDTSTWARSAILNVPRPLDKVLHSVVVATEILLLREQCLGHPIRPAVHPPTQVMICQLLDALSSMEEILNKLSDHRAVFSARAWKVLENVKRQALILRRNHRPASIH